MTRGELRARMSARELGQWHELYVLEAQEEQARRAKSGG